jgi:hypothetical protein
MSFFTPFAFIKQEVAVAVDADAQAYIDQVISVGGTLSTGDQTAINNLYTSLKSNSLYSELKYMYPFMGGTASGSAICGINPTNAGYTITWSGVLTNNANHTSAGVSTVSGNGSGTISTSITTIHSSVNDITLGAAISTATTGDEAFVFGWNNPSFDNRYQFLIPFDANNVYIGLGSAIFATYNNGSAPTGRWIGSRTSSTLMELYKDGTSVATQTGTNTASIPNATPTFFSHRGIEFFFTGVSGFLFAGNGLDDTQVSTLDGIISTFLTAIGR